VTILAGEGVVVIIAIDEFREQNGLVPRDPGTGVGARG
jgi:hypothetical protein